VKTLLALLALALGAQPTALDRYIAQNDDVYAWKLIGKSKAPAHTSYVLELTSQTWRSAKDVDKPVWKHWLTITKPDRLIHNKAVLYIGAGSNTDPAPTASSERSIQIATETNAIVVDLGMVPNQPLRFTDSPETPRSEDDLIAYSRV